MRLHRLVPALLLPLALGAIATICPAAEPAAAPAAAAEVEGLEKELVAAIAKTDLATYDRIVADDYVAYEPSGKENAKADILASYRAGTRRYTNLEIFEVRGRVHGDTAVVTARTRGFRREGDKDVPNNVRYIRVYARRDGKWRAVAQLAAPIPQPPA